MELAEPMEVDSPIFDLLDEFWVSPFEHLRFAARLGNCLPLSEHQHQHLRSKSNYWFYFIYSHRHNHLLSSNSGLWFEMDPMTLKSNWLNHCMVFSFLQIHWIKSAIVIFYYVGALNISGCRILKRTIEITGCQEAPQLLILLAKSALNFDLRLSNGAK